MKKTVLIIIILVLFTKCESLTDEHYKAKQQIRDYLSKTLHNPKSLEEVKWDFLTSYQYKCKDTLKSWSNCVQITDFKLTREIREELGGDRYVVKLTYRAENGYGALRKGDLYASYTKKDTINFIAVDDIYYSKSLGKIKDIKWDTEKPKYNYYKNYYFLFNEGKSSLNGFYNDYPEFK